VEDLLLRSLHFDIDFHTHTVYTNLTLTEKLSSVLVCLKVCRVEHPVPLDKQLPKAGLV